MIKKVLVIVAVILTIGVIGYIVKQQADIQETNLALAKIETALAGNERLQMEAQRLNERANSTWFSGTHDEWALFDANYSYQRATSYYDKAKTEAKWLDYLQADHQRLLEQKLKLLGKGL